MLIPKTKEKILKVFFYNPQVPLYLREVARKTNISSQNAHKYLNNLTSIGFLTKFKENTLMFYKPNLKNPFLIKFFELFEIERKEAMRSKNKKWKEQINRIEKANSSNLRFAMIVGDKNILVGEEKKTNQISERDFRQKLKDPNFYNEIMKKRVVVFGEKKFWETII